MDPDPVIDLRSEVTEDGGSPKIDAKMGVSRPQDRFLNYLYAIMLHTFSNVIPTDREGGGGIEISFPFEKTAQTVEIFKVEAKTKNDRDMYMVRIPRCLLRRLEETEQNRVFLNIRRIDYFWVFAEDRTTLTQGIRIRCSPADFDWLTGTGVEPVRGPDLRFVVDKLLLLLRSFPDPMSR